MNKIKNPALFIVLCLSAFTLLGLASYTLSANGKTVTVPAERTSP